MLKGKLSKLFLTGVLAVAMISGCSNQGSDSKSKSGDRSAVSGDRSAQKNNPMDKKDKELAQGKSLQKGKAPRELAIKGSKKNAKITAGEDIRDFKAKTVDGKFVHLMDYKDRIILLDFWATWCRPCQFELPGMSKIWEEFGGKNNFALIGVSLDKNADAVRKTTEKHKLNYPNVFDGKMWRNEVAQLYGVNSIPFTVLIKDGKVYKIGLRGEALLKEIRSLMEG